MIERRQYRRAELEVPVTILVEDASVSSAEEGQKHPETSRTVVKGDLKNMSLAGFFAHVKSPCPLQPNSEVVCSVVIPSDEEVRFPFSRVAGKGWVVRLEPIPTGRRAGETKSSEQLLGIAVAFHPNVSALGRVR